MSLRYLDRDNVIVEVAKGLCGLWIVGRRGSRPTSHHRVKSAALPPRKTAAEAQQDLDVYAEKAGWMPLPAELETAMAEDHACL